MATHNTTDGVKQSRRVTLTRLNSLEQGVHRSITPPVHHGTSSAEVVKMTEKVDVWMSRLLFDRIDREIKDRTARGLTVTRGALMREAIVRMLDSLEVAP